MGRPARPCPSHTPHSSSSSSSHLVQLGVLPEEVDERALAKGVGQRGMEGERGVLPVELLDPLAHGPGGREVALVDDEDEVLVRRLLPEVLLQVRVTRPRDVAGVEHLNWGWWVGWMGGWVGGWGGWVLGGWVNGWERIHRSILRVYNPAATHQQPRKIASIRCVWTPARPHARTGPAATSYSSICLADVCVDARRHAGTARPF